MPPLPKPQPCRRKLPGGTRPPRTQPLTSLSSFPGSVCGAELSAPLGAAVLCMPQPCTGTVSLPHPVPWWHWVLSAFGAEI